jgi:hypothetical protein
MYMFLLSALSQEFPPLLLPLLQVFLQMRPAPSAYPQLLPSPSPGWSACDRSGQPLAHFLQFLVHLFHLLCYISGSQRKNFGLHLLLPWPRGWAPMF